MTVPVWNIELHSHTRYSPDSLIRLESLPEICRKKGIDKLAITDHNTAQGALQAARLYPMLVIPGEEIKTTKGELLAWYIQEEVPAGLTPEETIRRLREQGAVIGVPHPFDRYRGGAWKRDDLLAIVDRVDAIEVLNARCLHDEDNRLALEFAEAHGRLKTVGSDAHLPLEYGRATVQMGPFTSSANGFREALRTAALTGGRSSFLVHFGSTFAKWSKRLLPSLRSS
jgi:predicted metal-dependent phosphoesterase TrpH